MHGKILPHFQIRRDKRLIKDEVSIRWDPTDLELPSKRDLVIFCPLKPRQIAAYQALIDSEGPAHRRTTLILEVQWILRRNQPCTCGSDLP